MQIIVKDNAVLAWHDNTQDTSSLYPGCDVLYIADGVAVTNPDGTLRSLDAILADSDPTGAARAELSALDFKLPRAVEDLVDAGAVAESSLPAIMRERLVRRRELRGAL